MFPDAACPHPERSGRIGPGEQGRQRLATGVLQADRRWRAARSAVLRHPVARALGRLLLAVLVGGLLAWALPLDAWLDRRQDWQLSVLAPAVAADAALVVDVDEASVRRLGAWPLRRDAYVPAGRWLIDAGAQALVFGMLLVDARTGDEAFGQWLAEARVPVLLGARSLVGDGQTGPAQPSPPGCLARAWPAWQLPLWARADGLVPGQSPGLPIDRVGALSVPLDEDNLLRRLPLWQQAGALSLPVLPLVAWQQLHPQAGALHCAAGADGAAELRSAAGTHWPLDAGHRLQPWLPRAADLPAPLSLARLDDAAGGRLPPGEASALAQRVRGRVVFIGSSAALGDEVPSVGGARSATALLAGSYDALAHGRVLVPPQAWASALLLAVGLLPTLAAGLYRRPAPLAELGWIAAAVLLLLALDTAWLAWGQQLSAIGWPLAMLGSLAALALRRWRRLAQAERQRLQQARAEAEAANRVKSEFLAHVSHEIRTPLHALLGAAELLAGTRLDAQQARHVGLFQGAGQELLLMLGDLLDLSKAEAGLLPLVPQPFSLSRLVASQVLMFEARAAQKGLVLQVDADPDLPDTVVGDAGRLAQVLRNLLSNALKFTSVGSVTLAVHPVVGRAWLRFEVRDTGIGVPVDRVGQLFEAYVQADPSISQRFGGTGLGLAISRRLVEAMGGRIGVHSREGLGATFHFELPLPATSAAPVATPAGRSPPPGGGPAGGPLAGRWAARALALQRPLRLLLVDDNPHALRLTQAYLDGAIASPGGPAVQIVAVHDGAAALRCFEAEACDIVLMDLHMPVLDGLGAARRMREIEQRRRRAPALLVALSGDSGPAEADAALDAGFDAQLGKPCSRTQLLAVLGLQLPGAAPASAPASTGPGGTDLSDAPALQRISQLPDSNLDEAIDRLGSAQLYGQVLAAAIPPLQDFDARLAAALDTLPCDLDLAHRLAHDLKAIAATLGLPGLAADARQLELRLRDTVTPTEDADLLAARRAVAQRLAEVHGALAGLAALPAAGASGGPGGAGRPAEPPP